MLVIILSLSVCCYIVFHLFQSMPWVNDSILLVRNSNYHLMCSSNCCSLYQYFIILLYDGKLYWSFHIDVNPVCLSIAKWVALCPRPDLTFSTTWYYRLAINMLNSNMTWMRWFGMLGVHFQSGLGGVYPEIRELVMSGKTHPPFVMEGPLWYMRHESIVNWNTPYLSHWFSSQWDIIGFCFYHLLHGSPFLPHP